MGEGRWQRTKEIVACLLEAERRDRTVRMGELCAGDDELRREVETLLRANDGEFGFLDEPACGMAESLALDTASGDLPPGGRIGPYRLIRKIESGGMGVVYQAVRDGEFAQTVAIKVVKPGMDADFILERFQAERRIVAALSHPNIAMLLDGGSTPEGRPYFAMEFVEGANLTVYLSAQHLDLRRRLELFRTVCAAVHYAHQNLVVHRDLKPSNILVTADGIPKLLDFGIAKILNPDLTDSPRDRTLTGMFVMTPDYASPEQVRGETVTTATDIYSLGVLLYEVLTGKRPHCFENRSPAHVRKVICEDEPVPPSAACGMRELRGDLDNIVFKAMHNDPGMRYRSAEQLSEDIHRYLSGMPVLACRDTAMYRARKFVQRHRTGAVAAALMVLVVVAGVIALVREDNIARRERVRAERRFNDVRKLAGSMVFELHDAIKTLPGSTPARKLLVSRGLEYLDTLAPEAAGDLSLQREVASAYERIGDVLGWNAAANLGDTKGALASYRKALRMRQDLAAAEPANVRAGGALADTYMKVCDLLSVTGDGKSARENCDKGEAIARTIAASHPKDAEARSRLSAVYSHLATFAISQKDLEGALGFRRQELAVLQQLTGENPVGRHDQINLAHAYKQLGAVLAKLRQFDEATEDYHRALAIDQRRAAAEPPDAAARMDVSFDLSDLGYIYGEQRDFKRSESNYRQALAIREALGKADPKDARVQWGLSSTHLKLGAVLIELHQNAAGIDNLRKGIELREGLAHADPASASNEINLADAYSMMGDANASTAKSMHSPAACREAKLWYKKSLAVYEGLDARGALDRQFSAARDEVRRQYSQIGSCE